ncbi:hypothetical protein M0R45_030923 [Rubus argutus]|uniref:Uncharacterized protein n=1 Tax=Rubus argutus TaxID=59490 RepID=A0AAW1WEN2_RUBAR
MGRGDDDGGSGVGMVLDLDGEVAGEKWKTDASGAITACERITVAMGQRRSGVVWAFCSDGRDVGSLAYGFEEREKSWEKKEIEGQRREWID